MVTKHLGFDRIVGQVVQRLGDVELALIIGSYAKGVESSVIDLVLVGGINRLLLLEYVEKTEILLKRKLRPLLLNAEDFVAMKNELVNQPHIVIWGQIPE